MPRERIVQGLRSLAPFTFTTCPVSLKAAVWRSGRADPAVFDLRNSLFDRNLKSIYSIVEQLKIVAACSPYTDVLGTNLSKTNKNIEYSSILHLEF